MPGVNWKRAEKHKTVPKILPLLGEGWGEGELRLRFGALMYLALDLGERAAVSGNRDANQTEIEVHPR